MNTTKLHRIYLDEEIPEEFEQHWLDFQALNPGWEFITWGNSEEARDILTYPDLWDKVHPLAGRTDILRYEIIRQFGGIYVDTDVRPIRSYRQLLQYDAFVGWESEDRLCPTVFGADPNHPAMEAIVEALPNQCENVSAKDPVIQTGPIFITEHWRERDDIERLPMEVFYPVGPTERNLLDVFNPPENALSVHLWNKGWGSNKKRRSH